MQKNSKPSGSTKNAIAEFPVWLAILLVGVLPAAAYFIFRQSTITLGVFTFGILVCLLILVAGIARNSPFRRSFSAQDTSGGKGKRGHKRGRIIIIDIYPILVVSIVLAWFVTGFVWVRLPGVFPSVLQGTLFALAGVLITVLFTVTIGSLGRNRPWLFTVVVSIFFVATLSGYYFEVLHFLLDPFGGALTALSQQGQWAPTAIPLIIAIVCLVLVGAAVVALRPEVRNSPAALLGHSTISSPIFFGWYAVVIYILFRAMLQAYGLLAAVLISGILIVLGVLSAPGLIGPIFGVLARLLNIVRLTFAVIIYAPVVATRYSWTSIRNLYSRYIEPWFKAVEILLERPADILGDWLDTLVRMINEPDASDQFVDSQKINDAELLVRSVQQTSGNGG